MAANVDAFAANGDLDPTFGTDGFRIAAILDGLATAKKNKADTGTTLDAAKKKAGAADAKETAPAANDDMQYVAAAVQNIVTTTLRLPFSRELCVSVLEANLSIPITSKDDVGTLASCYRYLEESTRSYQIKNNQDEARATLCEVLAERLKTSSNEDLPLSSIAALCGETADADSQQVAVKNGTQFEESGGRPLKRGIPILLPLAH